MADVLTKESRSRNMKAIKSISRLEKLISTQLWKRGYRFRTNTKNLFGNPDISIKKYKIVIFIDSCFWHKCPIHATIPKTNTEFWTKKLEKNKTRDKEVTNYYINKGWNIKRFWEHDIKQDAVKVVDEIENLIVNCKLKN